MGMYLPQLVAKRAGSPGPVSSLSANYYTQDIEDQMCVARNMKLHTRVAKVLEVTTCHCADAL